MNCRLHSGFAEWLATSGGSVLATTYQAGALIATGWNGRQNTLLMRRFDKPMGLDVSGNHMVLATRNDVLLLQNDPLLARTYDPENPGRYDALFLPRVSYHTADLNIHDVAIGSDVVCLVNTRFSCLAHVSDSHNFRPVWAPPFISELAPEDRCHLNGLALRDGQPAYVTALGESDDVGGWRAHKADGGIVIDVVENRVIARGLAMPHSPCWHMNALWILNSGLGELLKVDPATGEMETVCTLPGYLRGLAFTDRYALVGLSRIREKAVFGDVPVATRNAALKCGIALVDVQAGDTVGLMEFTSGCEELFGLRFVPGIRQMNVLSLNKEQSRQAVSAPDLHYWLREENLRSS